MRIKYKSFNSFLAFVFVVGTLCNCAKLSAQLYLKTNKPRNVDAVLKDLKTPIDALWSKRFLKAGLSAWPKKIVLVALKKEKILEVWAQSFVREGFVAVHQYNILAASGTAGPKLKQGDLQVPEGIYPITWLHSNSAYHLSLKIGYPSKEDKRQTSVRGFSDPGGDIFIHGSYYSIGCIAIGDAPIEELFYLVAKTKRQNVTVVIAPVDLRIQELPASSMYYNQWVRKRHQLMKEFMLSLIKK